MLNPIIKLAKYSFLTLALGLACSVSSQAQVKFGLRAGLNIGNMTGEKETDDDGATLESFKAKTRVAFAATLKWSLTERFGVFTELGFVQKGSYARYEGISYMRFPEANNQMFRGQKRLQGINVINGYIELPVGIYYEVIDDKLMLEGGATFGLLVSSKGSGVLKYIDQNYPDNFVEYNLDYRYFSDEAGEAGTTTLGSGRIGGNTIYNPKTIGAYYFNEQKDGSFFNRFDLSFNVGAAYYLSKGLRVGARFQYSLLDITNNYYDVSLYKLDNNAQMIKRNDFDRNIGVQVYIGLQF